MGVSASASAAVALVVRSPPYGQRSARTQIDVALLAAAAERPLRLYFVGAALLQLLGRRDTELARLPAGYRAWASLPELTRIEIYGEPEWIARLTRAGAEPLLQPRPMNAARMREDWRGCAVVLVL